MTKKCSDYTISQSFDIVNFLRVAATLFVFFLHGRSYIDNISDAPFFNVITKLPAWAGVWIFLLLSGYTVGLGFFKGRYSVLTDSDQFSVKKLLKFYLGRFLKIAPFYYLYCFLWVLLNNSDFFVKKPWVFVKMLTFTFNGNGGIGGLGHLWYISTAIQMYLIMPFVYILIQKLKTKAQARVGFISILLLGLGLRIFLYYMEADWYTMVYTSFWGNIDFVVCGMLVALFKTRFASTAHHKRSLKVIALVLFLALVVYNVWLYIDSSARSMFIYKFCLPTGYILTAAALICYWGNLEHRPTSFSFKALVRNPLRAIDWFSPKTYVFYIFHIVALKYSQIMVRDIPIFAVLPKGLNIIIYYALAFAISLVLSNIFSRITKNHKIKLGM